MSGPAAGFLEFFILEAGDYVEQLDGVLLNAGTNGPDAETLQRVSRALRGTATMAKLITFADLAGGVERVGRSLQEGSVQWDPALGGVLIAAIDDLKILLRGARTWSRAEDQRATSRSAELARFAPARASTAQAPTPSSTSQATTYLATEAANIAAGLELLTTRAGDPETASNVLRRVRALRGVAGVKEIAPLAEVLEATEDAGRGLESALEELSPEARRLLETAAGHLRTLAMALRTGGDVNAASPARDAFATAVDAWISHAAEREQVVPISDLFFADGQSGLVQASPNPPTSASQRFRLELVSHGEHLRQVVDAARKSADTVSTTRVRRDLQRSLQALQAAAESFGEHDVADFVGAHIASTSHLDFLGLAALEDLATVIAEPGADGERLRAKLADLGGGQLSMSSAIGAGFGSERPADVPARRRSTPMGIPAVPPARAAASAAPRVTLPTPVAATRTVAAQPIAARPSQALDSTAAALIDNTIAALDALDSSPLSMAVELPEDALVPIETLLYRGRAALDRAVELRDEIKRAGAPESGALDELFDLLELARAD